MRSHVPVKVSIMFALTFFDYGQSLSAQNLVPNFSFENFAFCPDGPGDIISAYGWNDAIGNTTDYFNPCGSFWVSAPSNGFGYQVAADGNSYCGFRSHLAGGNPYYYEFPAIQLLSPLDSCQLYRVSFKISRGNGDDGGGWATDQMGVALFSSVLSTTSFSDQLWGIAPGPIIPAFTTQPGYYLTDATNWVEISATYLANGGEIYLVIGNFQFPNTDAVWVGDGANFSAYYYLDDVRVEPVSSLLGDNVSMCEGDSVSYNIGIHDSILWSDGSNDPWFTVTSSGTYWVTTGNPNCTITDTIVVDVHGYPEFSLGNDTTLCEGENFPIGTNISGDYSWNSGSNAHYLFPDTTGTYSLTVNWDGCSGTDEITIQFEDCIFVPSAFSPNGDGQNDVLFVRGYESGYFKFIVFDRWGNKVFETTDPTIGWDGNVNNQPGISGVYVYTAELDSKIHGGRYLKKGNVSLVR